MPFSADNRSPIMKKLVGIVNGVGASQVAVLKIPPGATYADLMIKMTIAGAAPTRAQLETMLTSWRLTVSGVEQWTLTGKQLIAIVEFYRTGLIGATGIVYLPLQRLWMDTQLARTAPNFGTEGESSFQLEITQDATSTIDLMLVSARIDPVVEPLGAHMMIKRLTPNIGALGVYEYPDLYKRAGDWLYALHFEVPAVADLTNIALVCDEIRMWDVTPAVMNQLYLEANPNRTIQSAKGFVHMDFANRGFDQDALPLTMKTLILELTFANTIPGQINILQEIGTGAPSQAGAIKGA